MDNLENESKPVTTTIAVVKAIDPDLTEDVPDDTIQALIDNAGLIALGDRFPKVVTVDDETIPVRDMATRYMALHLLATSGSTGKGVTVEKVAVLEKHYADTTNLDWLNRSAWGQAYLRLYRLYGGGMTPHYTVIQH